MEQELVGKNFNLESFINKKQSGAIHFNGNVSEIENIVKKLDLDLISVIDGSSPLKEFKKELYRCFITSTKKKIFVIDKAEKMSAEVYNSLLKIIEEPSSTFFVFISNSSLPTTISSRCISFESLNFNPNFENLNLIQLIEKIDEDPKFVLDYLLSKVEIKYFEYLLVLRGKFNRNIPVDLPLLNFLNYIVK